MNGVNGVTAVAICAVFAIAVKRLLSNERPPNLPPGPKGRWIVGNLDDLLSPCQWRKFAEWSKVYGDIIYLEVLGRPIVILNKFEHARDLMDKRGASYSDRPYMPYIRDLIRVRSATFMPYGDLWRSHRRLLQQYLNIRSVANFRPIQTKCVQNLLEDLLKEPAAFKKHVRHFAASAVLSATYGYMPKYDKDPLIMLNDYSEEAIIKPGPPGATMVDLFPFLRYVPAFLPGSKFKRDALEARDALDEMSLRPYEMVKQQRASGTAVPSLLTMMLDDLERQGVDDATRYEVVRDVCGSTFRAGVATTMATLTVFIMAMLLHPEVARKAQEQLDSVLAGERLPSFDDEDALPYVGCLVKECLRWGPPTPLGIFHSAMEDGELDGKHIPKGSMIIPNLWFMTHDERNYVDPFMFNPDRFIEKDGKPLALDPASIVFGFGRRICPGRHFAEADLWLAIAYVLTVFDIRPEKDKNGNDIIPPVEFTPGLNSWPKDFPCQFIPRSEEVVTLLKQAQLNIM